MSYADAVIAPLEARLVTEEVLTSKHYTTLSDAEKAKIKGAQIVPARLGEKGFGGVKVTYKTAVYRVK